MGLDENAWLVGVVLRPPMIPTAGNARDRQQAIAAWQMKGVLMSGGGGQSAMAGDEKLFLVTPCPRHFAPRCPGDASGTG